MKTSELIGHSLNWAVYLALGNKPVLNPIRFGGVSYGTFESELGYAIKNYQGDWLQGGPIIEREKIRIQPVFGFQQWHAQKMNVYEMPEGDGPTPLVAAMRAFVASKLGDEVEIPEELC